MSVIYLVHPEHGAKVAISNHEAEYDEMHGWMRYDPTTPDVADEDEDADDEVEPAFVNELAAPKRRGRRRASQED